MRRLKNLSVCREIGDCEKFAVKTLNHIIHVHDEINLESDQRPDRSIAMSSLLIR